METLSLLAGSAGLGCLAGRWLGPRLGTCPYRLSAWTGAGLPILLSLPLGLGLAGIGIALPAAVGIFLAGHRSRALAAASALAGGLSGALAAWRWLS